MPPPGWEVMRRCLQAGVLIHASISMRVPPTGIIGSPPYLILNISVSLPSLTTHTHNTVSFAEISFPTQPWKKNNIIFYPTQYNIK